ncbi:MAG: metalloprotease TldD [Alphaproteobacteria bacterium]|jgi:TldD protein|nr:metalloprotease TldD [Alphaproteobacteria bacterium]MDG1030070.1 metalloprotease TldD [Alphaproteobacteria bacterium]
MDALHQTDELFFSRNGLDKDHVCGLVADTLNGADDGDLFLEMRHTEALAFDDGRLKTATYDESSGFGLRAIVGEADAFAHAGELSEAALRRAAETVASVASGHSGTLALPPLSGANKPLYTSDNPLEYTAFEDKVALLQKMDAYARASDPRVKQVTASVVGSWQAVQIIRPDGERFADIRPLVRLGIAVVVEQNGRMESGSSGMGGRFLLNHYLDEALWQPEIDEALRLALLNLDSIAAPAGEMEIVLGAGWPGVMLHEAVGHGLEGDFNRKGTSVFSGRIGEQVAAKGVTVVDNGTLADRRGSLTIDDEGTRSGHNTLIEDGILKGYMQDRQNARLMGVEPTGNGRRQSYAHLPMPRMTNTYMENGAYEAEEIISSMKKGIYAANFGGGQVDITSGKFVFSASEAYMVENGKIGAPVKGATLIGSGPDAMSKITMIGNDMELDPGIGTCGKSGQSVPVGVGQPTLKIGGITVGGTQAA